MDGGMTKASGSLDRNEQNTNPPRQFQALKPTAKSNLSKADPHLKHETIVERSSLVAVHLALCSQSLVQYPLTPHPFVVALLPHLTSRFRETWLALHLPPAHHQRMRYPLTEYP